MSRPVVVLALYLVLLPACASLPAMSGLAASSVGAGAAWTPASAVDFEEYDEFSEPAPIWARLLLWVPNRLLDALDLFSFDLHVGIGAAVDVHVTRAFQVAAVARGGTAGIGWHWGRSLGVMTRTEAGVAIGPVGVNAGAMAIAGTSGADAGSLTIGGLHGPGDEVYAMHRRDYWAAGASVTAAVVGVDVDVHLGEILDFVLGLVLIDIYGDDIGS